MSEPIPIADTGEWVAKDLYHAVGVEVMHTALFHASEARRERLEQIIGDLNRYTAPMVNQPVVLDRLFFLTPDKPHKIISLRLPDNEVIQGSFQEFVLARDDEFPLAIKMLVNLEPSSSPGVFREEMLRLWVPEAQALRWPNFDYKPTPKNSFWRKAFRFV